MNHPTRHNQSKQNALSAQRIAGQQAGCNTALHIHVLAQPDLPHRSAPTLSCRSKWRLILDNTFDHSILVD